MGCPDKVTIGDTLVFSICTHDPDTGILTDAESAPSYRLYEDETATPILTGSMAKLDDANTTGFYVETVTCSSGNGFENAKTYTIYIEATVDGDTGGISYAFKAEEIESGVGLVKALRAILAACAGKLSGAGGTTVTIRDVGDATDRITATVDANGNRTAVTLDLD